MIVSQSQKRKTGQAEGEYGSTDVGQLTQTWNNFGAVNSSNSATIKRKISFIEEQKTISNKRNDYSLKRCCMFKKWKRYFTRNIKT